MELFNVSSRAPQHLADLLKAAGFCSPSSGSSNMGHSSYFCGHQNWRYAAAEGETFCAAVEVVWREHPECSVHYQPMARNGMQWYFSLLSKEFAPGKEIPERDRVVPYHHQGRAPHFWLSRLGGDGSVLVPTSRIMGGGGIDHLVLNWCRYSPDFDQAFLSTLMVAIDEFAETRRWPL